MADKDGSESLSKLFGLREDPASEGEPKLSEPEPSAPEPTASSPDEASGHDEPFGEGPGKEPKARSGKGASEEEGSPGEEAAQTTTARLEEEGGGADASEEAAPREEEKASSGPEAKPGGASGAYVGRSRYQRSDGSEKERVSVYVEPGVAEGLKLKATLEGTTKSEYVAEMLREAGLHIDQVKAEIGGT